MKSFFLKSLILMVAILFAGLSQSCTDSSSSAQDETPSIAILDSLQGMAWVSAKGKSTFLGSDAENAKASDRPKMKVSFDYDFLMGVHEVTCGEFNKLMKSETGLVSECEMDSLPVNNVSYYDAVLFANARSKAEKMDTAYSYSKANFDENHNCTGLEKLHFSTEVNAYRLPTEAEWVLVASEGWNAADGWHNGNSDYERHKVCTKKSKGQPFCDFAGNVMEWVNDWLGYLSDTTVLNYMGAPDGGAIGERVVKGGCYTNDSASINWYSRGDVYTVTSATKAKYVGFRLALGKVENPSWIKGNGSAMESHIQVLTSVSEMRNMLGTYESKIVFRNELTGNLAFVDFEGGLLPVMEIADTLDCYHPEISPDGEWVAFSTKYEGVGGTSSLYVRKLNWGGDSLVKLDVKSAAIPRWRVLEDGSTVIVYVTSAEGNESNDLFKGGETWQVPFADGNFGEPKKLYDGNYHGGVSKDGSLAVTGSRLLRINLDGHEDTWYNGEQACNVSLSPVKKQTLFLDFGGTSGKKFVGSKYATHGRLLIMDSTGTLIQSVASPKGYAFDHSEWNVGNFNAGKIVVTLSNSNGVHEKIALVNLNDSSVVELISGDELWHPSLWIGAQQNIANAELDMDSAGVYFVEGSDWIHELFRLKMGMFWDMLDSIEILAMGSSRVEEGIIPKEMKSGLCLNMGYPGNDMNASLYVAENYGFNHLKNLKAVIVSLDLDLWQNLDRSSDHLFNTVPGYIYDANHDFWKNSLTDDFLLAVKYAYPASNLAQGVYVPTLGYVRKETAAWGDAFVETDSSWSKTHPEIISWNLKLLEDFVKKAADRNVIVLGIIFPQNPRYQETGSWGRYGPTRTDGEAAVDSLMAMAKKYSNLFVMDENKMGKHDYSDSLALNTDHLAYPGASKITARVDSLLRKELN